MKKNTILILLVLLSLSFIGCDNTSTTSNNTTTSHTTQPSTTQTTSSVTTEEMITAENRYQVIDLYSVNDFHGGAYNGIEALTDISGFIEYRKAVNENTIFLTNGDIFQGAALSNYYYGRPIVEAFNLMSLDGFVLGNHEFDWGIDEILKYRDSDTDNGEMVYPILAANIVYKDSQNPLPNTVPYIIKEVSGVRVGVIGLIDQLEDSISASKLENIEFKDPVETTYHYARELRVDEDCDIVVVYIHGSSEYYNSDVATFTGEYRIDAVFNGHTHRNEMGEIDRSYEVPLFYAQANNRSGDGHAYVAHISLEYDRLEEKILYESYNRYYDENPNISKASNYAGRQVTKYDDIDVDQILNEYANREEYMALTQEVLTTSNSRYDKYDLAPWGANVIRDYLNVDFASVNVGGFRADMENGEVTMGEFMVIYPFDNYIKTCEMTGSEFRELVTDLQGEDIVWDDSVKKQNNRLYINGELIDDFATYTIASVDYVFDKTDYGFLDGDNIRNTGFLMRDLLVEDLRNVPDGLYFNPYDGTFYQDLSIIYDPNHLKELLYFYSI